MQESSLFMLSSFSIENYLEAKVFCQLDVVIVLWKWQWRTVSEIDDNVEEDPDYGASSSDGHETPSVDPHVVW